MILLEKLELGDKAKLTCESCEGTGVYQGASESEGLAVMCYHCNGTGNKIQKLAIAKDIYGCEHEVEIYEDQKSKITYMVVDGEIRKQVELFSGLKKQEGISYVMFSYVMYGTVRIFKPSYLFSNGATDVDVVKYSDFLNGIIPLPMKKYTCPRMITQSYSNKLFYNNCEIGWAPDCEKFGKEECWNKFYDGANSIEEKKKVLIKMREF